MYIQTHLMFVPIFYGDVTPEGDTKLECSSQRGQGQQEDKLSSPVGERTAKEGADIASVFLVASLQNFTF